MGSVTHTGQSVEPELLTPDGTQPALAAGEKPPVAAPSEPELTWADVQAALQEQARTLTQQFSKQMQSGMDKRASAIESNILKRIEASKTQAARVTETAKKRGVEETAAAALGQQFFDEDMTALLVEQREQEQAQAAKTRQQVQPEPGTDEEQLDEQQAWKAYTEYVTQQGERLGEAWGLELNDPEVKMVKTKGVEEEAYYESIKAAGQAKRARLAREAKAGQPARPGQLPALGPSGGAATRNTIATIEDPDELYELAEKRRRQSGKGY